MVGKWEKKLSGKTGMEDIIEDNQELDRRVYSYEANREDIQNYEVPIVVVGCDVNL